MILNGARPTADPIAEESNAEELANRLEGVAVLADWGHGETLNREAVAPEAGDWYDLAQPPRSLMQATWPPSPLAG